MGTRERELMWAAAQRFWATLDVSQRWEIGDALVLGDLDWRDWLERPPAPGFWGAVDRLRVLWEEIQE